MEGPEKESDPERGPETARNVEKGQKRRKTKWGGVNRGKRGGKERSVTAESSKGGELFTK